MTQIARKYDFTAGAKAQSGQVDEELDQLVASHNDLDTNKASKTDVLMKGGTAAFAPVLSTDPTTKGYVDQEITQAQLGIPPVGGVSTEMLQDDAVTFSKNDAAGKISYIGGMSYAYKNLGGFL